MAITKTGIKLVADDSSNTGKPILSFQHDNAGTTNYAHGVVLCHPDGGTNVQAHIATTSPGSSDAGLVVRDPVAPSMLTSLQLIDDAVHSGNATASKYVLIGAVRDDTSTAAVTENNAQSLRMSSRRALLVEGVSGGEPLAVSTADATTSGSLSGDGQTVILSTTGRSTVAVSISGSYVGFILFTGTADGVNYNTVSATDSTGTPVSGTGSTGVFYVPCAGLSAVRLEATGWTSDTATITMRAGIGERAVSLASPLPTGTNTIGSVTLGAGSSTVGRVAHATSTTGGTTSRLAISAASTNATSVKAGSGTLYGVHASNANAAARYVKLYNKSSAPTVGTDTPAITLRIPAGGETFLPIQPQGIAFSAGIAFAMTTGVANTDTGAVAADDIVLNLQYA